jgi:hypothetical protein
MVYWLYFDKLDSAQCKVATVALGVFLFIESLILLTIALWAYWLVAVSIAIVCFGILRYPRFSRSHLRLDLLPDLFLYVAILIGTYFTSGKGGGGLTFVPSGRFFRFDIQIFLVAVFFVTFRCSSACPK